MAQGQQEATKLLHRTRILWDNLHPMIKKIFDLQIVTDNNSEITLSNGSSMSISTSFRGSTLNALHVSEMGHIANKYPIRAEETLTGSLQTLHYEAPCVFESTAEGDNLFKGMCDQAKDNITLSAKDFKLIFLSWIEDPKCVIEKPQFISEKDEAYFKSLPIKLSQEQKNFYIVQKRLLGHGFF